MLSADEMIDSTEKDVKDFFGQNFENFIYLYFLNEFFCSIKNRKKRIKYSFK